MQVDTCWWTGWRGRGHELRNLRLVDYLPPEQVLSRMADARK
ncbi:MAG: hypothetical protein ACLP7A_11710 [Desulfobaccales bacterium]